MKQAVSTEAAAPKGLAILDRFEVGQQALPDDEPLPAAGTTLSPLQAVGRGLLPIRMRVQRH